MHSCRVFRSSRSSSVFFSHCCCCRKNTITSGGNEHYWFSCRCWNASLWFSIVASLYWSKVGCKIKACGLWSDWSPVCPLFLSQSHYMCVLILLIQQSKSCWHVFVWYLREVIAACGLGGWVGGVKGHLIITQPARQTQPPPAACRSGLPFTFLPFLAGLQLLHAPSPSQNIPTTAVLWTVGDTCLFSR